MGKICPKCARSCPETASFCPICATDLRGVAPLAVQPSMRYDQVVTVAPPNTVNKKPSPIVMYFIPLILCIVDIVAAFFLDWFRVRLHWEAFSFSLSLMDVFDSLEGANYVMGHYYSQNLLEEVGPLLMLVVVVPLIVECFLIFLGSCFLIGKKTAGKVLVIIGNSLLFASMIIGLIFTYLLSMEVSADFIPQFGIIYLLISSLAGIIFAACTKTGKAIEPATSQVVYYPVYNTPNQPVYTQQYPNQNY